MEKWLQVPHVRAVCNGTSAIKAALLAVGVKPGDYVITTAFTFVATGQAINHIGAKPLFVDIDPVTHNIDTNMVWRVLEPLEWLANKNIKVSAILPVHLFGVPCDIDKLAAIRDAYNIPIVEDACQAIGRQVAAGEWTLHDGTVTKMPRFLGTFFDAGAMSGYASKNLWAAYEAGWVLTKDPAIAHMVELLRNHGLDEHGKMIMMGYNWKMNQLSAFNAWTQLKLHKKGILAELGSVGPENGYYPLVVYDHPWYQEHPDEWFAMDCPNAEQLAEKVRDGVEV